MAFPVLDAMSEGYNAYPVVDFTGGTSVDAHRAALARVVPPAPVPPPGFRSPASCSATGLDRTMKVVSLIVPTERLLKE